MGGSVPRYWAFSRQTTLAHGATTPRSATTEPLVTQGFRRIAGRQLRRLRRGLVRLNHEAVLETLRSFGPFNAPTLMVHSSLSACGYIVDGSAAVIDALRQWIADRDTACRRHTSGHPQPHA